jgi:1-deoxy-D-xylulose-5-phosphate synthase
MRFVKPLDEELLHEVFSKFNRIITIEDGTVKGGFGSAILEFMNEHNYKAKVKILGIPDRIVEHGSPKELYNEIEIDANHIVQAIREMLKVTVNILP